MRELVVIATVGLASAFALVIACGGGARATRSNYQRGPAHPTGGSNTASSAPAPDAGVAFTAPGPLACAPSYADLRGACDPKVSTQTCSYPEGVCYCGVTYPCSGVEHAPEEVASWPTTWQCTPTPPKVRPDGCPGVQPGDAACSKEGQVCSWGDCCFTQMTCKKGKWEMTGGGCPP